MNPKTTRRNLLLAGLSMISSMACEQTKTPSVNAVTPTPVATMPQRLLGQTGLSLPILGLGGAGRTPLSKSGQEKAAIELIEAAFRLGIRYFDTAANYGPSEDYLGQGLRPYRRQVILASKTDQRNRDGAWQELEKSLKRLNTDYLDIWQLHHVSFKTELDQIFQKNGAIQAVKEAQEQGVIRLAGITGHHEPEIIVEGLRRYPFDMTLICLNAAEIHHPRSFASTVLPVTQEKNIGVIAMKIPAYGRLFQPNLLEKMDQAMGYVLSLKGVHSCIIAAENVAQLESNIKVADAYQMLSQNQMKEIEQKTASAWQEMTFFRQWT